MSVKLSLTSSRVVLFTFIYLNATIEHRFFELLNVCNIYSLYRVKHLLEASVRVPVVLMVNLPFMIKNFAVITKVYCILKEGHLTELHIHLHHFFV